MSSELNTTNHDVHRASFVWSGLFVAVCAFATGWVCESTAASEVSRRERSGSRLSSMTVIVAAPLASVTFAAPPTVTAPMASVSRFSLDPLPLVASVVGVRLLDQVMLSRHGGPHGP